MAGTSNKLTGRESDPASKRCSRRADTIPGMLLCLLPLVLGTVVQPETSYVVRVDMKSHPDAARILRDFDTHDDRVIVMPEELPLLRKTGLSFRIIERGRPFKDIVRERQKANPTAPPDSNYFTVAEIEAELLRLERAYPQLARRIDITALTRTDKTHDGNSLFAIKISDNVSRDEDEPAALIASQHHARELNSPYMAIQAARRLLDGYTRNNAIRAIVDANEIWIVPCVNPDGVDYVWNRDNNWRKNRRRNSSSSYGVDLNRNYAFQWGKCGASTRTTSNVYRGPAAMSEPETKTMAALARMRRFGKYLDFHSYGQEVLHTYSPCTLSEYRNAPVVAMHAHYRKIIADAMRYDVRNPSASGEAQEWHWAENGSLSFLVEVGRSFQPQFSDTVAEERRVWPGVLAFLELVPAIRGHVRSLKGEAPLGATLDASVFAPKFGERARSRADTGRLHLWLPPGSTDVSVTASGHTGQSTALRAPAYGSNETRNFTLIPTLPQITLDGPARQPIGRTATLTLRANDPGKEFWIPMALGTVPGLAVPPRVVPINPDAIFTLTAQRWPGFYAGHFGRLDARGEAQARFTFPAVPAFIGFRFSFVGMTFESDWPQGIKAFSRPLTITLTR